MKLKGILDFSLGNFLCMRGFAPMGELYELSDSDPSFQREFLERHSGDIVTFLRQGEFLFFPEVILSTILDSDGHNEETIAQLFESVKQGISFKSLEFDDYRLSSSVARTKSEGDARSFDSFQRATMTLNAQRKHKFSRIDGNHRLSATPKDPKFQDYNVPFCLILFRNSTEAARFSRVLFHNINYKQVPLTMEQNLKLILDDTELFTDDELKEDASFGWHYYHARQINNKLDFELLTNIQSFIKDEPRTFLVQQFKYLIEQSVLGDNENAVVRFKKALSEVNSLFETQASLKDSTNPGLLAALVYYQLHSPRIVPSFVRWVLENHLHYIDKSNPVGLIQIFDKILASRNRTIFVSMAFNKDKTEDHYRIIERVCKEVSDKHDLKPALKVERVDWFHDGTSYVINDKILSMMSDCGLLIGNLTYCNPNVYHEIGFVMGKAKAEGADVANMLLFLDESVPDDDKFVGFNLRGIMQLRFTQPETQFAPQLKENIERFFKLNE